jgi:L-threonylcarbamoyladenylate synthase
MPTETVYGLAANAFDEQAVQSIFVAKNRPQDNPLIVHVHKDYDINSLVEEVTPLAKILLKHFTPGPITLVMKSNGKVCSAVSRGLSTVAIRIPSHKIAQKLLKECNLPIAAPSANISSRMSATTAIAVKQELDGKLSFILDGGTCKVGIESTVVDVTGTEPIILRPGKITKEELLKVVNSVDEKTKYKEGEKVFSPGVKYKHYSPNIPVFVCPSGNYQLAKTVYADMLSKNLKPLVLCMQHEIKNFKLLTVKSMGGTVSAVARNLYSSLRDAEQHYSSVVLCAVSNNGFGSAVLNRMSKMNSYELEKSD